MNGRVEIFKAIKYAMINLVFLSFTSLDSDCVISCNMSQKDYELQNIKSILEEKERDLLLSASIGKELLDKNTKLECKINELQAVLKSVNENHDQLSYQLSQKNDLINILTRDDDCDSENGELILKTQ